jgi:cytosol alanyl aminopeptidase
MRSTAVLAPLFVSLVACGGADPAAKPPAAPVPVQSAVEKTASPTATTPIGLRLPEGVRPQSYALKMRMSPKEESFAGVVEVQIAIASPTDTIHMHAGDNLVVKEAKVGAKSAKIAKVGEDRITLTFDEKLGAATHKLTLAYDGKLPAREGKGAYRQEENGEHYIFTQFESTDARRAFPCFDEPGFKTPYQITMEVPAEHLAFANTPQTNETPNTKGWKTVSFAPSQPLPSYLVAFAVGPFEIVDGGKAGAKKTPIRIIVPKGRSGEAKYAAEQTGKVVEKLEAYFGIPYPYEKLDHIAVPQKGGAMENPGLITYGTATILGKPEDKSVRLQRGYLGIAAHELGHIWFGDLVTTAWWDDIWLNEAFATWISAKIVDQMHPEWDGAVSRVQSKNGVMGTDSLVSTRKIRQPIESKHDIANAFDGITYQKGAAVISMFEAFVGEESFKKGVRAYLQKHAHGNATSNEFLADVGKESGKADVFAPAFSTFLDQPGIPLVSAELVCDKTSAKLVLTQQRYLPQGSPGAAEQTWKIPVCASYPGGQSCIVMSDARAELPLDKTKTCPAWVNPNANAMGYYRVEYKGDLLKKLLKDGGKGQPIHERVAVFGDALALVRSGRLPDTEVLANVPGLAQEGNRHLVSMAAGLVGGLQDNFVADEVRPNYARFVQKTFGPRAQQLGLTPKAGEDDNTRLLRSSVVGIVARDEASPLAAEAKKLTLAWLSDRKAIDYDLQGLVTSLGARVGDRAMWEKIHAEAKNAKVRHEREILLGAMGSFRDPAIVEENFKVAMSDEFDPRESLSLVWGAAREPKTRQMAYDFVKANFDKIVSRMPREWGGGLTQVGGGFCDAQHRADIEAFFKEKAATFPGGPRNLSQTLESVGLCDAQKSTRQASVTTFLKKY